jgi:hypothetical protein
MFDKSLQSDKWSTFTMIEDVSQILIPLPPELLHPFDSPPKLEIPSWAQLSPPRPLPLSYIEKKLQSKRAFMVICIVIAMLCLIASVSSLTAEAALYFLPLNYLLWIGIAIVVIGGLIWLTPITANDASTQVAIRGEPCIVRIEKMAKGPSLYLNGAPIAFHFYAQVSLPNDDGSLIQSVVSCQIPDLKSTDCTYHVGDYVLAFKYRKSIQLYGFAGLSDKEGIICRHTNNLLSFIKIVGLFSLVMCTFIFWGSSLRYIPLQFNGWIAVPVIIGILAGILVGAVSIYWMRRLRTQMENNNLVAVNSGSAIEFGGSNPSLDSKGYRWFSKASTCFVSCLFSTMFFFIIAIRLNVVFDQSYPHPEMIENVQCIMVTHAFVVREYKIEFTLNDEKKSQCLSPQEIIPLLDTERASLQVRSGAFGWSWVSNVLPRQ